MINRKIRNLRRAEEKLENELTTRAQQLAQKIKKLTMLEAISSIVDLAEDSELSDEFFQAADMFIRHLSDKMNITPIQAVLLALATEAGTTGDRTTLGDMARYVSCRNVKILQYQEELDDLVKRGFMRQGTRGMNKEVCYLIPEAFIEAMKKNEAYTKPSYVCEDGVTFFQKCYDITHLRYEDVLSSALMVEEFQCLLKDNEKMPYVKALRKMQLTEKEELVVTHFCRHLVLNGEERLVMDNLAFLCDSKGERYYFCHSLETKRYSLIQKKVLEMSYNDGFQSNEEFQLSEKVRKRLLKGFDIKMNNNMNCDVLSSKKIVAKNLFFEERVNKQIDELAKLISEKQYQKICLRLKRKGMRQGFTCLFYGAPGTGKTESVLQLARQSGRDILQVNIADVKSKWVGDSEKNIKAIFDRYRMVVHQSKRMPILLFNEADAVISTRKEGAERAVDKMENAIQNIILQEMERLDGIMIATTNLEQNMDKAFERRFLYKVKFERPSSVQRMHIWQSMMPKLSHQVTENLAKKYAFSGGQIENIARKCDINSVLYGEETLNEATLEALCIEETLVKRNAPRIGFT